MIRYRFEFHGKAAHAAVQPEAGINALNAVIHTFNGVDSMRQHLRSDTRIHGVITDGGSAPNVVPEFASADFILRSRDRNYLNEIVQKVIAIANGAATMTGARLEIPTPNVMYENVRPNTTLAKAAESNAHTINMKVDPLPAGRYGSGAPTDFGNISHLMPSFAMRFAVAEEPVTGHSRLLTEAAKSAVAQKNAINTAKVLALTACDLLTNAKLIEASRKEFRERND